jgi:hypothetical protein
VKAFVTCYNSKADIAGNRYWAFRWVNIRTGREVVGTISGGESNISVIVREMGLDWKSVCYNRHEMGIRDFNRMVKDWPYAGCCPDKLASFIKRGLHKRS